MKKIFLLICLSFIGIMCVNAKTIEVEFSKCVDGDTAKFIYKDEEITARFLAIDTPETVHPTKGEEKYGKEASEYTCNKIKNAKEIKLEYDKDSDELDKYNRHLVWVFVDGELLQKKLISKGYASVAYLYGDYKYTEELELVEQEAEENKLGIWSNEETSNTSKDNKKDKEAIKETLNYKEIIMLLGIVIILCVFSTKARKTIKKKAKKELVKQLKKRFK